MTTYMCIVLLQVGSYYISFCNPLYSLNVLWLCVHGLKIDIPHFLMATQCSIVWVYCA